ncbi:hypothetical protein GEV33_006375 [Tenebrio molitor]|uniref:Uncharacterized protein n=1 Tax=Tenebrio molitor TaxID=7067 RepID=A0A8J6HLY4_TENMO|nr:hypothetical protein GEV33_006375 [Tenebrio molitor]
MAPVSSVEKYYTVGITANSNNSLSNVRFTAVNFDICNYLDRHPFELSNVNVARCEVLSVKTVLARPCGNLAQEAIKTKPCNDKRPSPRLGARNYQLRFGPGTQGATVFGRRRRGSMSDTVPASVIVLDVHLVDPRVAAPAAHPTYVLWSQAVVGRVLRESSVIGARTWLKRPSERGTCVRAVSRRFFSGALLVPESPKHRRALAYSVSVRALYSRMIYLLPPGATGVTSQHPPGDYA